MPRKEIHFEDIERLKSAVDTLVDAASAFWIEWSKSPQPPLPAKLVSRIRKIGEAITEYKLAHEILEDTDNAE